MSKTIILVIYIAVKKGSTSMAQQHAQFEEEFRDGPQPHDSYQDNYVEQPSATYTTPVPPQRAYVPPQQAHGNIQGRLPLVPVQQTRPAGTGIGARVTLAIFSMIFMFGMFMVALAASAAFDSVRNVSAVLAVIFAFVFALVVLLINLIVNLVSLRR